MGWFNLVAPGQSLSNCVIRQLTILLCSALLMRITKGNIMCICNTPECRDAKLQSCQARYHCFVEYHLEESGLRFLPTYRGCINEQTPLNCERLLPHVKNSHLRTSCCHSSWCNEPSKTEKFIIRKKFPRKKPLHEKEKVRVKAPRPRVRSKPNLETEHPSILQAPLNPMRIAAPIAAACIVLSFIIFIIFLVKRRESQQALNHLVYSDYDPSLLAAALGGQGDRCDRPVLNPRLYNPFLKAPIKTTV